ncbi:MAG TPA: hypothetical protein PK530_23840 [Anaerolineales bacterium]|nr:hypothetical protein [Anaerolineales bacterium]
MSRFTRTLFIAGGLLFFLLTAGFAFRFPIAVAVWPWPDTPLSFLFLASIAAAIGAPMVWIGAANEPGAIVGGALNLGLITVGTAIYMFVLYTQRSEPALLGIAVFSGLSFFFILAMYQWSKRFPIQDQRPTPKLVRISFGVFLIALLFAATLLVIRFPTVFPWPLNPDSSVIFGLIFYGNSLYFLYGILRPFWNNARGQLLAFLLYDLVLIVPFFRQLANVKPDHRVSLILYLGVLIYSGGLAVYYLFIHPSTRDWSV